MRERERETTMYNNGYAPKHTSTFCEIESLCTSMDIPQEQKRLTSGLTMNYMHMARLLNLTELYKQIIGIHGVIMEFGVHWGNNLTWLANLHTIFEPMNKTRKIIGFDTFEGFPHVDENDGDSSGVFTGNFSVPEHHADRIRKMIQLKDTACDVIRTNQIDFVIGDVCETLPDYMSSHPETIVAMAYFDLDLYTSTKNSLECIWDRVPKGGIIAFDEACNPAFPGETIAIHDVLSISNIKIERNFYSNGVSYIVK